MTPLNFEAMLERRKADLAHAEEWRKQKQVAREFLRAGQRGLIERLGLGKIVPVDIALKRIARASQHLRAYLPLMARHLR
jgi:hypothetical protein